jgi:hypothetical protein
LSLLHDFDINTSTFKKPKLSVFRIIYMLERQLGKENNMSVNVVSLTEKFGKLNVQNEIKIMHR